MAYDSTTWSTDSNTKASLSASTNENYSISGTLTVTGAITANGGVSLGDGKNISVTTGDKMILDGGGSEHTYFTESSNDVVKLYAGVDNEDTVRVYNMSPKSGAGVKNTIYGYQAGSNIDSASQSNSYFGAYAGDATHSTATANSSFGSLSLSSLTTGDANTCMGAGSGYLLTLGSNNVAVGRYALDLDSRGDGSVAIGYASLTAQDFNGSVDGGNTSAYNTAVGYQSGYLVTYGEQNTFLGYRAGNAVTTGDKNTCIGGDSDATAGLDKQVSIGYGVTTNAASQVRIGNDSYYASLDASQASQSFAATSDIRIKKDIENIDLGLDFINMLRPVKYREKPTSDWPKEFKVKDPSDKVVDMIHDGLIAQEVKEAADKLNSSFSGWGKDADGRQELQYGKFVSPLIKAVQELSKKIDNLS